ncbi:MAG: transposase [Bryobacteraceae bacterium]
MIFYRRRLPHWQPEGVPIFLTWRLFGSLPRGFGVPARQVPDLPTARSLAPMTQGQRFVAIDRWLDHAATGPTWLADPQIAQSVIETVVARADRWGLYDLFAWVLMSNHVHMLVQPHKPLREVTRAVKNSSPRAANLILGRTRTPFWQDESFDRWVRDRDEFDRIVWYIEHNPVSAGLVERSEQWPWSSASGRDSEAGPRPAPADIIGW